MDLNIPSIEILTSQLVKIESTNPGVYENKVAAYILKYFNNENIQVETDEVIDERYNIMATIKGSDIEDELVYICHMDTVPVADGWTGDAFSGCISEGLVHGRGSCDMKGGLACMLSAFLKIAYGKYKLKRSLKLILTVDEESDMKGVERVLSSGWIKKNSYVLDAEPTSGAVRLSHKGRLWFHIEVDGITAHASMPEKGADAIAAMAKFITELRDMIEELPKDDELGRTTITFGRIDGGKQPYIVPDYCETYIDIRNVPPNDTSTISKLIDSAKLTAEYYIPGVRIKCESTGSRTYIKKDNDSFLLKELMKVCKDVNGVVAELRVFTGYTDTAVIAATHNNINCASYGPGDLGLAHKPDEFVPIEDLIRCEEVYYTLAKRLCLNIGE